jgi:hypothetical protein
MGHDTAAVSGTLSPPMGHDTAAVSGTLNELGAEPSWRRVLTEENHENPPPGYSVSRHSAGRADALNRLHIKQDGTGRLRGGGVTGQQLRRC